MPRSALSVPRQVVRDFGTCLKLDGVDDKIESTSTPSALNSLSNFSIALWYFADTYSNANGNGFQRLLQKGNNNGTGWLDFAFDTSNSGLQIASSYNVTSLNKRVAIPSVRNWHFVVATGDGSTSAANYKIYVDGVEQSYINSQDASGVRTADGTVLTIGNRNQDATQRAFQGKIDEVRVFNRILSATEVSNLYYGTRVDEIDSSGLVGKWLFNEGSGTTATDSTGNANGTITGATYSTDVFIKPRTAAGSQLGNGVNFINGASAKIVMGAIYQSPALTTMTATHWIYITQTPSSNFDITWGFDNTRWFFIFNGATTQIRFHIKSGGAEKGVGTVTALNQNQWYFVAGKYDGSTVSTRVYDTTGTLIATGDTAWSGTIDTTSTDMEVGHSPTRGHYFVGYVDDCRLYSSLIADADLQKMATFIEPASATLTARWRFDSLDANKFLDDNGGNPGTRTNVANVTGIVLATRKKAGTRTSA